MITAAHCTLNLPRGDSLDHVKLGHADLNDPCGVEVGIEGSFPHPSYGGEAREVIQKGTFWLEFWLQKMA